MASTTPDGFALETLVLADRVVPDFMPLATGTLKFPALTEMLPVAAKFETMVAAVSAGLVERFESGIVIPNLSKFRVWLPALKVNVWLTVLPLTVPLMMS